MIKLKSKFLIIILVFLLLMTTGALLYVTTIGPEVLTAEEIKDQSIAYVEDFPRLQGETDDTERIKRAINSIDKGKVIFSSKDYKVSSEIRIRKYVRLVGAGNQATFITLIKDTDGIIFEGKPKGSDGPRSADNYLKNSSLGVEGITIRGKDSFTKKALSFIYVGRASVKDVIFSHYGGNALYFRSAQDMVVEDCYFRYTGNQENKISGVFMDDYNESEGAISSQNVNDIKFIGCTFEHDTGPLFSSIGRHNNSINFTACKFEYVGKIGDMIPINIKNGIRFQFYGCRFTHYNATGMFYIENSSNIEIRGATYNNQEPSFFVNLQDTYGVIIDIVGRKTGKVNIKGNSYNIDQRLLDSEHTGLERAVMEEFNPGQMLNLRNVYYPNTGTKIVDNEEGTNGAVIQLKDLDYKRAINFRINNNPIVGNDVTFWVKAKSSSSKDYEVRIKGESFERILKVVKIGEEYNWYEVKIPSSELKEKTNLIINSTTKQDGITLTISQIYYKNTKKNSIE
ncbi:right-handed parallel beta-helix repeat-containing protein [Priestia megaterium]|uniref:right-handed parallel beta-helix repeat-containing protein n=1 Tax=Priestia megaterium TaxID=1404 RepID=UPI002571235D|nr:right-handed parallel beta-helix repeat-containing protein [Priestia megaterium]WJD82024.1 right-handed parallel beta-helix repeat-containing protein [Priestia megaterium]